VIGSEVARQLFLCEQALGERLLVGGAPFIVIGVLQEKGLDATGVPQDDRISGTGDHGSATLAG
jgi:hypothetical protein